MLKLAAVKSRLNLAAASHSLLPNERRFSSADRINYLVVIALTSLTLLLARWLRPAPGGVGTHEQLGLPPCPMLHLTGWPCPSCGLTTSFAHAVRLDFYQAFITQPFGLLAFCLTVLSIPLALYLIHRRITWASLIHARGANVLIYFLLACYLSSWVYKVLALRYGG